MKLLFLDIDGVLNGHEFCEGAQSNTIRPAAIESLNYVLREVSPKVVLSSAWRYMIHCRAMTLLGFEYLLRTHGTCGIVGNLIGVTCRDEECGHCGNKHKKRDRQQSDSDGNLLCGKCGQASSRGDQITAWLRGRTDVESYVAVDDENYGITKAGHPLVQTNGAWGMTMTDAKRIVRHLKKSRR